VEQCTTMFHEDATSTSVDAVRVEIACYIMFCYNENITVSVSTPDSGMPSHGNIMSIIHILSASFSQSVIKWHVEPGYIISVIHILSASISQSVIKWHEEPGCW